MTKTNVVRIPIDGFFGSAHVESKEDGKDQESIQSSTTPGSGHTMGKYEKHKKNITHKRAKKVAFFHQVTTRLQGKDKTV